MIKGINKQILEVTNPDSPYFEKIIFFVRSDAHTHCDVHLKNEAEKLAQGVRPPRRRTPIAQNVSLFAFAALGIGAGVAITFMFSHLL